MSFNPILNMTDSSLTGNEQDDINKLRQLDRTTLLKLCENDIYILNLCNNDLELYKIITAPQE